MTPSVTKDHLDAAVQEITRHFNQALGKFRIHADEQFSDIQTKLDAIMSGEVLVTRKQLQRLLHALRDRGIELNEEEILTV